MKPKTLKQLDKWIEQHPQTITKGPYKGKTELMSRYDALCQLYGNNNAATILQELSIKQCC